MEDGVLGHYCVGQQGKGSNDYVNWQSTMTKLDNCQRGLDKHVISMLFPKPDLWLITVRDHFVVGAAEFSITCGCLCVSLSDTLGN